MTQALANLVDNAIKYAPPHGAEADGAPADILVEAGSDGDFVRLSVSDHGPGIAEGDRERAVQRFVRLEQSRSEPGSGLGLSLASAVAHLHGGELRLEDNGPGLKATLVLPRGGPASAAAERIVNRRSRGYEKGMARPATKKTKPAPKSREDACLGRSADAPRLTDRKAAQARVAEWLTEIGRSADGKALKRLLAAAPKVEALLVGLSDGSPYLWDLAVAEPERLLSLLNADPDQHLAALLAKAEKAVDATKDEAEAMRLLRRMKAEAALLIALADIGGVWPVMRATHALTELADTAIRAAVRFLLRDAAARGRLKPADRSKPEEGSGHIVLAMGKMGAFELNYSSDIDLIVFYDRGCAGAGGQGRRHRVPRADHPRPGEAPAGAHRGRLCVPRRSAAAARPGLDPDRGLDRNGAQLLRQRRPELGTRGADQGARSAPAISRPAKRSSAQLAPFIWRKYLDYAAVADIEALKRQIHAYRGHEDIAVEGHNIKLGRGGIREIEFFVQTQQLVAGGRHPELRGRETLPTLAALAEGGWIGADARADLEAAYQFLRTIEHRLQMVADDQTHTLPSDREGIERFARFAGFKDRDAFAQKLVEHLRKVQRQYIKLFEDTSARADQLALSFPKDADDRETLNRLGAMGYRKPLEVSATVRRWLTGSYPSLRGEFARSQFTELVPVLLDRLARAENPDAAVNAFDLFIGGLKRGARLFSLLKQNPDLVTLVALTLGTAPRLADILARYPEAMDALLEPTFFGALPDEAKLEAELARTIEEARQL